MKAPFSTTEAIKNNTNITPTHTNHSYPLSPQSQSFSRSYGSNLPTSLIYIILLTRGYSPWRPDAVISTTKYFKILPLHFQGSLSLHQIIYNSILLYQYSMLIANWINSKHSNIVNKKRQLFLGIIEMSQEEITLPFLIIFGSGILTWFPFDNL